jgi:hypothetical protein
MQQVMQLTCPAERYICCCILMCRPVILARAPLAWQQPAGTLLTWRFQLSPAGLAPCVLQVGEGDQDHPPLCQEGVLQGQ